jgi:flagellar assembly factor FliW
MSAVALHHLMPDSATRRIASDILGPLDVAESDILQFPRGVLGFPDCRQFVLIASAYDGIFWLQSAEHSALTFVVADPFRFFPEYGVDVGSGLRSELQAADAADVAIFCIVTLSADGAAPPTMNLQGPLLVNARTRRAVQHVVPESSFGVRTAFTLPEGPRAA